MFRGGGYIYNLYVVKGYLGVEFGYYVLLLVKGFRVGEVGEGGGFGLYLEERLEGRFGFLEFVLRFFVFRLRVGV